LAGTLNLYTAGPNEISNWVESNGRPGAKIGYFAKGSLEGLGAGFVNALQTGAQYLGDKIFPIFGTEESLSDPEKRAFMERLARAGALGNGGYIDSDPITADELYEASEADLEKAKEGLGPAGSKAVDYAGMGVNLLGYAALSKITGIPMTTLMAVSGGGDAAHNAKEQGKSLDQQALYGLGTGLFIKLIEGLGSIGASEATQARTAGMAASVISKLPASIADYVRNVGSTTAAKIFTNFVEEGFEGGLDYLSDFFLQRLILDNNTPLNIKNMINQMLTEGSFGAVYGAVRGWSDGTDTPSGEDIFSDESNEQNGIVNSGNPSYNDTDTYDPDDLNADINKGAGDVGKIITKIEYKPSSGAIFKANPDKTTTILGSFDKDMKNIVDEMGNVKSTDFGAREGGFNSSMYRMRCIRPVLANSFGTISISHGWMRQLAEETISFWRRNRRAKSCNLSISLPENGDLLDLPENMTICVGKVITMIP